MSRHDLIKAFDELHQVDLPALRQKLGQLHTQATENATELGADDEALTALERVSAIQSTIEDLAHLVERQLHWMRRTRELEARMKRPAPRELGGWHRAAQRASAAAAPVAVVQPEHTRKNG